MGIQGVVVFASIFFAIFIKNKNRHVSLLSFDGIIYMIVDDFYNLLVIGLR
jgi:hypothetical protein